MGAKNGFPSRGGDVYVFSLDGVSPNTKAAGMLTTQGAGAPAAHYNAPD